MKIIDLSHTIAHGTRTYDGLPPVQVCDFLSRRDSREHYQEGTEFQLDQITLIGNSGTYIDSPFHRYKDGKDLSELTLSQTCNLPGLVIRAPYLSNWSSIDVDVFENKDVTDKAVLIETGWSRHFGTPTYMDKHPFLTAAAAEFLKSKGATLVGIDSLNIDDTRRKDRPVHSILLGANIPIVEHMTNLNSLPDFGFRFSAAPIKLKKVGTFPTRALAILDDLTKGT